MSEKKLSGSTNISSSINLEQIAAETVTATFARTINSLSSSGFDEIIDIGNFKKNIERTYISLYAKAIEAINQKATQLAGVTGKPVGKIEWGAGGGYFCRFQNGTIYYRAPAAPCWVTGAILNRYLSLGAEGGLLGYPTTDELSTSGNSGRYNNFQNGSIFWSYGTGAHEIHGAIGRKWASLGWEKSWLGFPTSDELPFAQDGRVSVFEHGAIYWWSDTGAIEIGNVSLQYKGLYCFGETDWDQGSTADEPYVIFGVVPVPPYQPSEVITQIYDDVDSGNSRPDSVELYHGLPNGVMVSTRLLENDFGDPNKYREQVKQGVNILGDMTKEACRDKYGPEAGKLCEETWNRNESGIIEFITDLIDSGDDELGSELRHFTAKEMVTLASTPRKTHWGIEYHLESKLFDRDGATYKVYWAIERV